MSLEAALAENTAALKQVAALLEESNKTREAALAKLGDGGEAAAPGRPTRRKAADKQPETKHEEASGKPEEKAKPPVEKSVQDLREAAVKFNSIDDADEKTRRKDFMKAVMDELGIKENDDGKRVIVNAEPADRAKIIDWFERFAQGEKINFGAEDEPAAADEDDIG